jgi:hypothetical protein
MLDVMCFDEKVKSVKCELPNDNLIVLISNIVDFIIEYNENLESEDFDPFKDIYNKLIQGIVDKLFFRTDKFLDRNKLSLYEKNFGLKLLSSLIKNKKLPITDIKIIKITKLYDEIIYYMKSLANEFMEISENNLKITKDIVEFLKSCYVKNMVFSEKLELRYCIESFKLIKMIEDNYNISGIDKFYKENQEKLKNETKKFDEESYYSHSGYNVYVFLSNIVIKVEVNANDKKKSTYFINPPMTSLLSKQTKTVFLNKVDRSSANSKLNGLISKSDYFMFEMFFNYYHQLNSSSFDTIKSIKMIYFEIINYIIISIQQLVLFLYYNRKEAPADKTIDPEVFYRSEEKLVIYEGNLVLSAIHIAYISLVLIFWIYKYSRLAYQQAIMENYQVKFIIKTDLDDKNTKNILWFTNEFNHDNHHLFEHINHPVKLYQKCLVIFRDLIILNRNINMFVITLILLIAYLSSLNSICLVLATLLISNLSELLYDIVYAIKLRWKQLVLTLLFTYLVIYIFTWIIFLYLYEIFKMENVLTDVFCFNLGKRWNR